MDYFPTTNVAQSRDETVSILAERTPVYAESLLTTPVILNVASGDDVVDSIVNGGPGETGLSLPVDLFKGVAESGDDDNKKRIAAGIQNKRMTALKASVHAVVQANGASGRGDAPDEYAAEQLERIFERLIVTIYATGADSWAMRPMPLRSLVNGVIFPEGTEPVVNDEGFRLEVSDPGDLRVFIAQTATVVNFELYLEAVFQ